MSLLEKYPPFLTKWYFFALRMLLRFSANIIACLGINLLSSYKVHIKERYSWPPDATFFCIYSRLLIVQYSCLTSTTQHHTFSYSTFRLSYCESIFNLRSIWQRYLSSNLSTFLILSIIWLDRTCLHNIRASALVMAIYFWINDIWTSLSCFSCFFPSIPRAPPKTLVLKQTPISTFLNSIFSHIYPWKSILNWFWRRKRRSLFWEVRNIQKGLGLKIEY